MRTGDRSGGKAPRAQCELSSIHQRFRDMRNRYLLKRYAQDGDAFLGAPDPKARVTDDAMASRLASITLSGFPHSHPSSTHPPPDDLEMEERPEEEREKEEDHLPRLDIHPELKAYIDAKNKAFSPWIRQPSVCSAVVVYEPPEAKLEKMVGASSQSPIVEFPSERPRAALANRFTRTRSASPSPTISELPPEDQMEM